MKAPTEPRRRRLLVIAGVAVLFVVAGALLIRVGAPESPRRAGQPADQTASGGATGDREGTEAGTPARDEQGAVAAAVAYTAAPQRWLYLSDGEIAAAVEQVATPEAARSLTEETLEEIGTAREDLSRTSGRVWWVVHPLAWRVDSHSGDSASVAVWTVTVLAAAGVAAPQTEWMTVTVDLRWVDGWRVDTIRDRPGPTPMTGPQDEPWDSQAFDTALDGFTRIDGEPAG